MFSPKLSILKTSVPDPVYFLLVACAPRDRDRSKKLAQLESLVLWQQTISNPHRCRKREGKGGDGYVDFLWWRIGWRSWLLCVVSHQPSTSNWVWALKHFFAQHMWSCVRMARIVCVSLSWSRLWVICDDIIRHEQPFILALKLTQCNLNLFPQLKLQNHHKTCRDRWEWSMLVLCMPRNRFRAFLDQENSSAQN